MLLKQKLFLLDENVSYRVKPLFTKLNLQCTTVQQQGWGGAKNREISIKIQGLRAILITRDRDFTFLWKKYSLQVIYIAIEPPVAEVITNELERLLIDWKLDLISSFLIVLQKDYARIWK
ncbi:MAG: DUF5615 family PIN-like protein [Candidatus Hodarchaeales archaeon]